MVQYDVECFTIHSQWHMNVLEVQIVDCTKLLLFQLSTSRISKVAAVKIALDNLGIDTKNVQFDNT